ncbi:DUF6463 family protein [Bacillus solimangrovi]|uniref:DUF4064 domain-containing protein n=1 Tax=Bacillus solimangrovi TaxID=1305675 RepID=A0A1E5LE73_9BACI|nr:DUF6463 family protein [Bacillus solimangrovi]OEH92372.1 hypothetical protein BFG57_16135 [Bacillus solimangrovi]
MKLWKLSGVFLIATGIIHTIVGLIIGWTILGEIIKEGLFNTVVTQHDRNAVIWFILCGVFWIMIGHFLHIYLKEINMPVPRFIGWYFLIISLFGVLISPISGFWLFIPQALIIILAHPKRALPH